MNEAQQEFERWQNRAPELADTMNAISSEEEFEDCFGTSLVFGTGGLRGKMGPGSGRMNRYTIAQATQGFANYLLRKEELPTVVIARDTRNSAYEFSKTAAEVLCAAGVRVWWFENPHPTPMLSFAVRFFEASAGIVITASHNPKEYNGYKVYNSVGGQITDLAAGNILAEIHSIDLFDGWHTADLDGAVRKGLLTVLPDGNDCDKRYYELVRQSVIRKDLSALHGNELSILYTPLYGSGNIPVRQVLQLAGFPNVAVVEEQTLPDGNFPGLVRPNPEEFGAFAMAIKQARDLEADLVFATDPDSDRIGVLSVGDGGEYSVLTGNQTGCLLLEYMIQSYEEKGTLPENAAAVKTIVTTDLAKKICDEHQVALFDVLTGFKYIGEKIGEWEKSGKYSFLFGFEESYGCLTHTFARDKDAVAAAVMIAQMALWHKIQGRTLRQALEAQWAKYGCSQERLVTVPLSTVKQQECMNALRKDWATAFAGEKPVLLEDYLSGEKRSLSSGTVTQIAPPRSNVLKFTFEDGAWLVLRPSGTEMLIKLYIHAMRLDEAATAARVDALLSIGNSIVGA
ncbi:MAG: phospho-sugar mutase [Oscillospiraceae bacterium]|jgi:phosphoglucomutase|nr:phospho-sugar mutase [Oscillospiraceae bacterium]